MTARKTTNRFVSDFKRPDYTLAIENLIIDRVVLHEVHLRSDDKTRVDPTYGDALLNLGSLGIDTFRSRVVRAFSSDSRAAAMSIRDHGDGSLFHQAHSICGVAETEFVEGSKLIADGLANAQTSRSIPSGLCVVFDGRVGHPSRKFIAIMKAETHAGFQKGSDLAVTFIEDLFLTPQAKLYKIGIFIADGGDGSAYPEDWSAYIYDDRMSSARREAAATYFHDSFLGLEIPADSAQITRRFFDSARDLVDSADLTPQARVDLHNSIYSILKTDQRPDVQPTEFRDNFLPPELHDMFDKAMKRAKIPDGAFHKDTSEIKSKLRVRKLSFSNGVQLQGPLEAIKHDVKVQGKRIDGERWTEILVRGALESE